MANIINILLLATCSISFASCAVVTQAVPPVIHAEGPHWDSRRGVLNFVDISGLRLYQWDPNTYNVTFAEVGGAIGFCIPVDGAEGRFLAGVDHNLVSFNWTGADNVTLDLGDLDLIATVETAPDQVANRWNDGKADTSGRLWAGTMGGEPNGVLDPKKGSLYSLETRSNVPVRQFDQVDISNGIAWNSLNNIMYYIDTPTGNIDAFDFFVESGVISNRRTVFSMSSAPLAGGPDGMTIDTNDNLWVALYGGSGIIQIDPRSSNNLLQFIGIPASRVTSLAFGGENLSTLFVTTSRRDMTDEELAVTPLAGSVFAVTGLDAGGRVANNVVRE